MIWRVMQWLGVTFGGLFRSRSARVAMLGGLSSLLFLTAIWGVCKLGVWAYGEANARIAQTLDLRIRNVVIADDVKLDVSETLERHGLYVGSLQSGVDWDGMRDDLARNPMLTGARIIRTSPDQVRVTVTPRQPIARIDHQGAGGETILVDHAGTKIRVIGQASDKNLITLSGRGAFQNVDEFWPLLTANPNLFAQVQAAKFVGSRRWDLVLKSGALVQLPQEDMALAMTRLSELMGTKDFDITAMKTIDLRAGDRLFFRLKSEPTSEVTTNVPQTRQG